MLVKQLHESIDYVFFFINIISVLAWDLVYTELSATTSLHCGSTSKPFLSNVSSVFWYKGDDVADSSAIILSYNFSDSYTRYHNGYSSPKYSCSSDGVLRITDVQTGDLGNYTCETFDSGMSDTFIVKLKILREFKGNVIVLFA